MKRPYDRNEVKGTVLPEKSYFLKQREMLTGRLIEINKIKYPNKTDGGWKEFIEVKILGTDGLLYSISGNWSFEKQIKRFQGLQNIENLIQIIRLNDDNEEHQVYQVRLVSPAVYREQTPQQNQRPPQQPGNNYPQYPQQQQPGNNYPPPQQQQPGNNYPPPQQQNYYDDDLPF